MKYAITYTREFRYLAEVDEIIFREWSGDDTLLQSFEEKKINKEKQRIILTDIIDVNEWYTNDINAMIIYINKAKAEGYNIAVQIPEDRNIATLFREAKIDFMFSKYAESLDRAYTQAMMGASDVYVVENLGFRMKDIQYIRQNFGVKIRLIPNIAQIAGFTKEINPMLKFWIRPEDTELYEDLVDVFELYGTSRLSVVYQIYKERQWLGDINDIILDFDTDSVPNGSMPPHLGPQRLNCGQVCLAGRCNLCTNLSSFAQTLQNVGIEVRKDKYKPELTEEEKEKLMKDFEDKLNELRTNEESMYTEVG